MSEPTTRASMENWPYGPDGKPIQDPAAARSLAAPQLTEEKEDTNMSRVDGVPSDRPLGSTASGYQPISTYRSFISVCRCGARFEGHGDTYDAARQACREHQCPPRDENEVRTYWLSFCDDNRPKGQRFLGVAIVDVTRADADEALALIAFQFPCAQEGAEWIGAASRKAHREGCNPGGQMASVDITDLTPPAPLPKHRLLSFAELEALGLQPISQAALERQQDDGEA